MDQINRVALIIGMLYGTYAAMESSHHYLNKDEILKSLNFSLSINDEAIMSEDEFVFICKTLNMYNKRIQHQMEGPHE